MYVIDTSQVISVVQRALVELGASNVVRKITDLFPAPARVFLVGGFIRDAVLRSAYGLASTPRDLDFVVFGLDSTDLCKDPRIAAYARPTSLGGIKLKLDDWSADIWTPLQHLEVAGQTPYECTPAELPAFSTLTTDAVIFDFVNADIFERDFLRSMNEKTIDVGQSTNWVRRWAAYHLAHLVSVWFSTGFKLSSKALARIAENTSPEVRADAIRYLEEHKGIDNAFVLVDKLIRTAQTAAAEQLVP